MSIFSLLTYLLSLFVEVFISMTCAMTNKAELSTLVSHTTKVQRRLENQPLFPQFGSCQSDN